MTRRRTDAGVEECKGYSPPNDHTTSVSSTPLPLGSWNLNTGTRPTESESFRSARMARNRARYAQRTERQRLHDTHQRRMSGGSFRQHPGDATPAAGEYGSLFVINAAAQRFENKVLLVERSFVCASSVRRRTAVLLKKQEISIFDVCSASVPTMLYYLLTFLMLRTSLLPIALCVRFAVLRDAETRRAW